MKAKTQSIEIGGKTYAVNFGLWTLRCFCKDQKLKLSDLQSLNENMDFDTMIGLAFHGLKGGARVENEKFELTPIQVADILDSDENAFEKIMSVFSGSASSDENKEEGNQKGVK